MKKLIIYVIGIIIMLTSLRPINAMESDDGNPLLVIEGASISISDFKEIYVGKEAAPINMNDPRYAKLQLQIMKVSIDSNQIELNARIYDVESDRIKDSFIISGKLYAGHRFQTENVESIIVDADTNLTEITVLLFECVNGSSKPNYYADDEKTNDNSLRIFMRQGNDILLFEDSLPNIFKQCFLRTYDQISDPMKDILWYSSFIDGEVSYINIENDEEWIEKKKSLESVSTKAARTLWTGATIYSLNFYVNGDKIQQSSVPFGYYRICNVTTSDATWKAEIYIDESTKKNGTKVTKIDNLVRYKNVSLNFACGKKTEFQNVLTTGRIYNSSGTNITSAALKVLSAASKWWNVGVSIYNVFSDLVNEGGAEVTLGGTEFSSFPTGSTGIGVKIQSGHSMSKNSYSSSAANNVTTVSPAHYLICQAELNSTYTKTGSISTTGAICIKWTAYKQSDSSVIDSNGKKQATAGYTASY